jgi:hypothetical protein
LFCHFRPIQQGEKAGLILDERSLTKQCFLLAEAVRDTSFARKIQGRRNYPLKRRK